MTYARVRARRAHESARGGKGEGAGGGVRSPEAAVGPTGLRIRIGSDMIFFITF